MVDILLTHSYHLFYDAKQWRKMQPYRPLGLLYAAAALKAAGFSVAIFDAMLLEPESGFAAALKEHGPRIVAVYEDDFNFLTKMCLTRMRDVAFDMGRLAAQKCAATIVHGSDATDHPELFLSNGFDYVLCGEAEQTLVKLCSRLLARQPAGEISGMVCRADSGEILYSADRLATNPSWVHLPQPSLDLTDFSRYRKAWTDVHGRFSVNMVSGRGCPYRCNWCAKPISGNKFQLRPAPVVAAEMLELKRNAGAQHIWFGDDVFALSWKWVQEFADEVQALNAALPFKIQSRADLMSDVTVNALKTAGCSEVWMGVESGSQKILDAMDKGLTLSSVYTARERLKEAGIRACYFLQFGYPGETWEDLLATIDFVRETRPDDIGISFSYPLPGTKFYENVQAQLGQKRNWKDSADLCIMFKAAYANEFYLAVRSALHAEVDTWVCDAMTDEQRRQLDELWFEVYRLEPMSRNREAWKPAIETREAHVTLLSIDQLLAKGA